MNRKNSLIVVGLFALIIAVTLFYISFKKRRVELDSGYRMVMGTFARAVVIAKDPNTAETCIRAATITFMVVDTLMSDYKSDSDIGRANSEAAEKPVPVNELTYEVIKRSIEFSKLTGGAFDITVGPLVDLFRLEKKTGVAPSEELIDDAKSKVGYEKLILDDSNMTVQFAVKGMRLDLGGIAKGYAIDKAIEVMQQFGAIGGLVDIGGDMRCFGVPPKGKRTWLVGLQDPNEASEQVDSGNLIMTLKVTDAAVATSGDYRQFAIIEGKRRSHIIDSKTGTSTEGLSSVTIIADNATDADALATAVSVMGPEKGLALIEKLPGTEAILMTSEPEFKILKTPAAEKYIRP